MDAPASWGGVPGPRQLSFNSLTDVEMRPVRFVDKPFLQAGTFHLLTGIKNAGKGTWLAHTAARVTRGELGPLDHVVWLALGEDDYARDVKPRLVAHNGDPAKVMILDDGDFELPLHGPDLEEIVRQVSAGLVIVDPIGGAVLGRDTNADGMVRPALRALNTLAARTDSVVLGVRHISNKARTHSDGALSAILGSSDWVNIPRSVLALMHDDEDRHYRHLFVLTGNRTDDEAPGIMLRIEGVHVVEGGGEVTRCEVVGESLKDPDELLAAKVRKPSRSDATKRVMLRLLDENGGSMESDILDAHCARVTGLAVQTLRKTRVEMKDKGLIRVQPQKDEAGVIRAWFVMLTNAGRLEVSSPTSTSRLQGSLSSTRVLESESGELQPNFPHSLPEKPLSGQLQGNHQDDVGSSVIDPLEMAEAFNPQEDVS